MARNHENFTYRPDLYGDTPVYWVMYTPPVEDPENFEDEFGSGSENFFTFYNHPALTWSESLPNLGPMERGRSLSRNPSPMDETRVVVRDTSLNLPVAPGWGPHPDHSQPQNPPTSRRVLNKRLPPHLRPRTRKPMIREPRDVNGDCAITKPIPSWKKHTPKKPSRLRMEYKPELEDTSGPSEFSPPSMFDLLEPFDFDIYQHTPSPGIQAQPQLTWTPPAQYRGPSMPTQMTHQTPIMFEGGGIAYPMNYGTTPAISRTSSTQNLSNRVPNNASSEGIGILNRLGKQVTRAFKQSGVSNAPSTANSSRKKKENRDA